MSHDTPETPETPDSENITSAETADTEAVTVLPVVALRDTVIFPEMIVPLQVGRERSVRALDRAVKTGQPVALITQRNAESEEVSSVEELYSVGTLAKIGRASCRERV